MQNIVEAIRKALKEEASKSVLIDTQRWFKEEIKTYGLKSASINKIIKTHFAEIKHLPKDVIVLIDPFEAEWQRIKERYVDAINLTLIAIAPKETPFKTIIIPALAGYDAYLQLFAGWNLLVQTGIACGIDIDKPKRARKVGNAY